MTEQMPRNAVAVAALPNPGPRVLIVEDELPMRTALADCLRSEGYRVITAADGATGLQRALAEKPDLVLLDVMMPQVDGFALCSQLRRTLPAAAILFLSAKAQWHDRVKGLDVGGDDYLIKPFRTEELLARLRALWRRVQRRREGPQKLTVGATQVDLDKLTARNAGREVHLTAKEFAMLRVLAEAAGQPVSREEFLDLVWGYSAFPTTRTVDTHIASLRSKLEPDPDRPQFILTVHGVGYRLGR